MAETGSEVTSAPVAEKSSGMAGSIVDSSPVTINNQKLNGNNFLPWSRAVELFIIGRGKKDYLSEDTVVPAETDSKFPTWEAENSMIMSWLLSSMTPEISNTFMLYPTAAAIWKATKEMYAKTDNISELYELEAQVKDMKQGDQTVSKFFSNLSQVWQQIDSLESYKWGCIADSQLYGKIKETKRLFGFLSGLHKDYDAVRGRILSSKPLPSMNSAFSDVRQEESRMKVMMGPSVVTSESSALKTQESSNHTEVGMFVKKTGSKPGQGENKGSNKKFCKFCHREGHIVDECYRRPGSTVKPPAWFRQSNYKPTYTGKSESSNSWRTDGDSWRSQKAALVSTGQTEENTVFTQAHLDALLKVLSSQRTQVQNDQIRATMAYTGMGGKNLNWVIDSGATNHMTYDDSLLSNFKTFDNPRKVKVANGDSIDIVGYGDIQLSSKLILKRVLFVPKLDCNLISVKKLMNDNSCWTIFSPTKCYFLPSSFSCFQEEALKEEMTKKTIGNANHKNGLFILEHTSSGRFASYSSIYSGMNKQFVPRIDNSDSRIALILLWHKRLGHPNFVYQKKLKPDLFRGISFDNLKCETCVFGKQTRSQYPAKAYMESKLFNLIHCDIWGPSRVLNVNGCRWFVIFIDDHTRVTWIYLMKHKSELASIFKRFVLLIQNQFNVTVKTFRSDNGSEFLDKEVKIFLGETGIHHQTSNVYTPQQNGVAERKHRHILEVARSIMFTMNVPKYLWGEAVLTATYLINRMPSRVLGFISPKQKLLSQFPHCLLLSELPLKTFGCTAYVYLQSHYRSKIDKKIYKVYFYWLFRLSKGV